MSTGIKQFAAIAGAVFCGTAAQASNIVYYDLTGQPGSQLNTPATLVDGVTTTDLVRGPGVNPTNLGNGMSSNQWSNNDPLGLDPSLPRGSRDDALANGDYYEFAVSIETGHLVSFSTLDYSLRRSGLGAPADYEWQYSLDSFNTPGVTIAQQQYLGRASGTAPPDAHEIDYTTTDLAGQNDGNPMPTLDLTSFADLQDLTDGQSVTFRLYGWGADRNSRTVALGRYEGPALGGTVIPEPASLTLVALGGMVALRRRRC